MIRLVYNPIIVQSVAIKQSGQAVHAALVSVVRLRLRAAAAHAQLCAELRVLHDVRGHRAALAHVPGQPGWGEYFFF